jgi:plasmid stabilization system protein ParE
LKSGTISRPKDELVPGLRSVLAHPHVIFYRTSSDTIEVARVLHQRRDLAAIFSREPDRGGSA